ncbi:MAG: HAD-IB family hydrolase [Prevotella sp.]|nr:HAD-IB family hydrolase [Prevotella sp.]
MKKIVACDFDGTLTTRDTFVAFIRDVFGDRKFLWGFLRHTLLLVKMFIGFCPGGEVKERIFAYFFKGMSLDEFDSHCQQFAASHHSLLRPLGIAAITQAQQEGAEVVIISASIDNWVQPFFPNVRVIGTKVEVKDGCLTGRFLSSNCFGQEKVNRLLTVYPQRSDYHLTAYGDSKGDRELLAFADESYYKPFRR